MGALGRWTNLEKRLNLTEVSSCARLDERDTCRHAHLVHVSAGVWFTASHETPASRSVDPLTEVVEGVENNVEGLEPLDIELGLLDIRVDRLNMDVRIECAGCLSCHLECAADWTRGRKAATSRSPWLCSA